jgi:cyclohexanecarboxylate-CoA ligase
MSVESSSDWPWLITATTLIGLLDQRVSSTPDTPFLLDEQGAVITFAEFRERAERVAAALVEAGIRPGSKVAWQLPTRISTILVMAALRRIGAVQEPIIALYREREVAAALSAGAAEFLLTPGTWRGFDYTAMAASLPPTDAPRPRLIEIGYAAPESSAIESLPPVPSDPEEIAWIYFTSGSTGKPKGARHSDSTLLATGIGFAGHGRQGREPGEVAAAAFPFAHIGGIEYLIVAIAAGFPMLLLEAFVPNEALQQFRRHGDTTTGCAPPFYRALVELARVHPGERLLPTLRTLKGGGAPCPPELYAEVRDLLGATLAHDYGMTEVPMIAVSRPDDPIELLAESDGRVLPGNRVRIVDLAGDALPEGEVGEVQVSGTGVCHGYTDPAETERAFTPDGWFRTGDLGRVREGNVLEVVGRLKDMIIRKGENIAPQELEELLSRHPSVAEVAVIGLPDDERGEQVCAVVVVAPDEATLTLGDLTAWLLEAGLMRQKLPERLELLDALPRTGLAKVAKAALRERYATPART